MKMYDFLFVIMSTTKFHANIREIFPEKMFFFENFDFEQSCGTLPPPLWGQTINGKLSNFTYESCEDEKPDHCKGEDTVDPSSSR